jgi:hypothetical protein
MKMVLSASHECVHLNVKTNFFPSLLFTKTTPSPNDLTNNLTFVLPEHFNRHESHVVMPINLANAKITFPPKFPRRNRTISENGERQLFRQ